MSAAEAERMLWDAQQPWCWTRQEGLVDDEHGATVQEIDEALEGDLELEPEESDQVKGGYLIMCHACSHSHNQTDPKCNPRCLHGSAFTSSGPPVTY